MASDESHIIVDCEESLFSYQLCLAHYPLFTYTKLHVKSKKDSSLSTVLNKLSENPNVSITIVTACPYPQLIEKYLRQNILTKTSFSVLYAPHLPVYSNAAVISQNRKINMTPASTSPPPGYTLIYNHTLPPPKVGWENHAKILWQRLQNIDFFSGMYIVENACLKKAQSKARIKPLPSQQKQNIPNHFKPAGKDWDGKSDEVNRSPVRRVIEDEVNRSSSPFARN